ncbi:MAG: 4-hydroxy-3-methylbut-2-enyl diphosphate reductase, partial [Aestuariivirgaceae bacterium]
LIETETDANTFVPRDPAKLAYITQTTLSVDDTANIIEILQQRFPKINGPHKEDICYATTNRQEVVKELAPRCDLLLVVGAPNSSNSQRLVEVAKKSGCRRSALVQRAAEIDWGKIGAPKTVGITAGASAPEVLVSEVVDEFRDRFEVTVETVRTRDENVSFKLPRQLRRQEDAVSATS